MSISIWGQCEACGRYHHELTEYNNEYYCSMCLRKEHDIDEIWLKDYNKALESL